MCVDLVQIGELAGLAVGATVLLNVMFAGYAILLKNNNYYYVSSNLDLSNKYIKFKISIYDSFMSL